jgi:DnaJ-class molecular chaperone
MEILTNSKARQKKTGVGCEACKGNLWFYEEIDESTLIGWKTIGPEIFREKCQKCSGKGFIKETSNISCGNCSGKGWVLSESKNDFEICSDCQGNKRVSEHKKSACHHCDGLGSSARILQREELESDCHECEGFGNIYFHETPKFLETCLACYGTGQIQESMETFNFTVNRWKESQWRLLPEMQFSKKGGFRCKLDSDYLCEKIENSGFPLIPEHRSDSKYEFVGEVSECNCRRNPLCETCEGAGVYIHISVFGECLECEGNGVESIVCLDCKGMGKHVLCRYSEIV